MKIKIINILVVFFIFLNTAFAAQQAELICRKQNLKQDSCDQYELNISIQTGKDAGLRGGYGIVAVDQKQGMVAYWTEDNGWAPATDERLLKATEPTLKKLELKKEFTVFSGRSEDLCKLSNSKSFNVYAWYYGFTDSEFEKYRKFVERFEIKGWQAENVWNSLMFYKSANERKTGLVFSHECKG